MAAPRCQDDMVTGGWKDGGGITPAESGRGTLVGVKRRETCLAREQKEKTMIGRFGPIRSVAVLAYHGLLPATTLVRSTGDCDSIHKVRVQTDI